MTAVWALALYALYLLLLFGVQSIVQLATTQSSGRVKGIGRTRTEQVANLLFLVSLGLDLGGPALVLTGVLRPVKVVDTSVLHTSGFVIFGAALISGIVARQTMGGAWRTGIDPSSATPLVSHGLFAVVRNPVYSSMISTSIAVALLVPTVIAPLAPVLRIIGLEMQTRLVEEPFLLRTHGHTYREYAERVGRFLPLLGEWTRHG